MTKRTSSRVAIAALGLFGSASAMALESGFYLGAVGGSGRVDISKSEYDAFDRLSSSTGFSSSLDDSDTSVGLVAGGQIGRWFAVEAQLISLGEFTYESRQTIPNVFGSAPRNLEIRSRTATEAAAFTMSGILTVPIGESVALGFRLGLSATAAETRYEYEERRGNSTYFYDEYDNDAEASDVSATYGVSIEWDPVRHFGMRMEYQLFKDVGAEDDDYDGRYYDDEEEHDGHDVDVVWLSLIGRF